MINELKDIPLQQLYDMIIAIQKAINFTVSVEQITFFEKNHDTLYYQIGGKSMGKVYLNKYCQSTTSPTGEENEIQLSADDTYGHFKIFSGIKKALHWYFNDSFELKQQFTVIQDSLNHEDSYTYCLQMVAYLDKDYVIKKITYMYYGNGHKENERVIERTGDLLSSFDEENLFARYRYHQFKNIEAFNQMFDDIEGPVIKQLTNEDIENRLTVLEAIKY